MEFKFLSAFFFILIIGMTSTFPAKEQSDVEIVPVDKKHRMHDIYDTFDYEDSWYPRIPAIAFPDLSSIFKSVQDSLESVFKSTNGTKTGFPGVYFPEIDSNKTKKTSVTKTINGHKVEINETVYKDEDEHGGAFFKGSVYDDLNLYGLPAKKNHHHRAHKIEAIEFIDRNDIDYGVPRGHDLTNDIRVNKLLERSGAKINPNAEFIEDKIKKEIESLESFDEFPKLRKKWDDAIEDFSDEEEIDRELRPIKNDLSNDIRVNELLALRGARTNPDAEVFDTRTSNKIPNVKKHKKRKNYYY